MSSSRATRGMTQWNWPQLRILVLLDRIDASLEDKMCIYEMWEVAVSASQRPGRTNASSDNGGL